MAQSDMEFHGAPLPGPVGSCRCGCTCPVCHGGHHRGRAMPHDKECYERFCEWANARKRDLGIKERRKVS